MSKRGRTVPFELDQEPPVEVRVEIVAVFSEHLFVVLEGTPDVALRVPKCKGASIGVRRTALVAPDQMPPRFCRWAVSRGDVDTTPLDQPIPLPPPAGCCPPGQPMPTGSTAPQRKALNRQIETALQGRVPLTPENGDVYEAIAYMIRRAEGQGRSRRPGD